VWPVLLRGYAANDLVTRDVASSLEARKGTEVGGG
jgi:hypothetical protein